MGKARDGQTLIDVSLERSGSAEGAWELARELGAGLTDRIEGREAGSGPEVLNRRVAKRYMERQIHPATELTEGIGGWRVGGFKVG